MELKEDKHYDFLFLDYKFTKGLEFVINRLMKRKFDWFNSFKLNSVMVNSMSPWEGIHVFYLGVLNVDENWGEKMWIEEGQYGKFPGNREYDFDKYSGVLLNELVGSRIMSEISEVFNLAFKGVRPIEDMPKVSRVGRLLLHFDKNMKETKIEETIKRFLKEIISESDPKTGTGKKPKGSGRRLYTDENPNDTVSVKFRTKEDIIHTLNKLSFKSKPHKRQSQIINLIHQRVRAAYQNAKDTETKKRLKRSLDYITTVKEKSKEKTIRLQKKEQNESISKNNEVVCEKCGWSWKLSEGGDDPYTCHKCGNKNHKSELTEKCWPGYTQKGMKTMFGKRYPNCVKKTKKK